MLTTTISCPHCKASLKTSNTPQIGKRVRCPKCSNSFPFGGGIPAPVGTPVSPPGPAPAMGKPVGITAKPASPAATGFKTAPAPMPGAPTPAPVSKGNPAKTWFLAGLGGLLLAGAATAAILYFTYDGNQNADGGGKIDKSVDELGGDSTKSLLNDSLSSSYIIPLPAKEQTKVNQAIRDGVKYIKKGQKQSGSWVVRGHTVGYAAMPGLTLLACGVPSGDKSIRNAAKYVRQGAPRLNHTYQISLAILFLDKLGDPKDKSLIKILALRLIAGQQQDGGWTYNCPVLQEQDNNDLYTYLVTNRPDHLYKESNGGKFQIGEAPKDKSGRLMFALETNPKNGLRLSYSFAKLNPDGRLPAKKLTQRVKKLPIISYIPKKKDPNFKPQPFRASRSDNSNTQFAMMALWAARRHNVPMERTIAMVDHRFISSQNPDGGWGYRYLHRNSRPAMTCVGLIGLAMGHGSHDEIFDKHNKEKKRDPTIEKGVKALSRYIGKFDKDNPPSMEDLYFLWSVERVAMLYSLKTIGNKNWYRWAAQMLTKHQKEDGSWQSQRYHGSTRLLDTCLALLVLKQSNLVKDLTKNLRIVIPSEIRNDERRGREDRRKEE